mmetsp:Transcript_84170/g.158445  ORF Transcript_84170/g.158445 Transcript_84170/m.158445 type:complete len:83 (+) Transcript_84170:361-609(+)
MYNCRERNICDKTLDSLRSGRLLAAKTADKAEHRHIQNFHCTPDRIGEIWTKTNHGADFAEIEQMLENYTEHCKCLGIVKQS